VAVRQFPRVGVALLLRLGLLGDPGRFDLIPEFVDDHLHLGHVLVVLGVEFVVRLEPLPLQFRLGLLPSQQPDFAPRLLDLPDPDLIRRQSVLRDDHEQRCRGG
jgi:hypothetical protein